ncbi:hypothetical protein [Geomicrobium sp. JCM 19055]|uniref:hypothetical protein n=1 Tax=Geomicrobium sp. JCM 19055 TaxID=1460649 RepID=UPI0022357C53|nr:hypothetical protein [Geomicrobium sp. JCM 19055]
MFIKKILSTETTKNIKRLRRDIEKSHKVKTGSEDTKKNRAYRKIMSRLYELISTLEKDFNEKDKYLEVIVK